MNKFRNNFLFFKQSLKSIFKFKIQFLSILLLSFMSVLVLTSSLTIRDRLNDTYNSVVGNVEKFDYQLSDQLSFMKGQPSTNKVSKELMLSFLPKDSRTVIDSNETININFNSIYGRTFITEAFEKDNRMLNTFISNTFNEDDSSNWNAFTSTAFFWTTRMLMLESFYTDLDLYYNHDDSNVNYLKNVPIISYIDEIDDKSFIENDLNNIKSNLSKIKFDEKINENNEKFELNDLNNSRNQINDVINIQNKDIYLYASNAFSSLFAFIREFLNDSNWKFDRAFRGKTLFQFITGQDLTKWSQKTENSNWIVNEKNKLDDVIEIGKIKDKNYIYVNSSTSKNDVYQEIKKNGLKGKSTPIVAFIDENNRITKASIENINLNPLSMNSNSLNDDWSGKFSAINNSNMSDQFFASLFSERNIEWVTWKQNNYSAFEVDSPWTNNMINNYRTFLKIAAAYSNFEIEFRKEFSIFDNLNQIQYKAVVLDEYNKTNLKILNENQGGRLPLNKGEILISEQYAKAHNIKNNSEIKLGPQVLTVVGIATDTFSYYPIVDENVPVPQYKNSAIIYASEATFFPIVENSQSSSREQIVNTTINYFLWSKDKQVEKNIENFTSFTPFSKNIKTFNESAYKMNWTLQPSIVSGLLIIMISISIIVGITSLLGVIIYIKKMVKSNIKQIAILKALGVNSLPIACSYAVIGLIITLLIIPAAWITGTFIQLVFIKMFVPYFSIQLSQISISLSSLLIGVFLFGFAIIILSVIFAYIETREDVTLMLNKVGKIKQEALLINWINRVFANSKFTLRFSLIVSASAIKNTTTTVFVIFMSSFLVFFGLSIPALVETTKNGYYNHLNYSNQHRFEDNVYNAPLSKSTISYTEDLSKIDLNFKSSPLMQYYANPTYSYDSSFDVSPLSKYIYSKNQNGTSSITNTFKYIVNDSSNAATSLNNDQLNPNSTGLFQLVTEQFGNNFANGIGSQFSVGMIDQALNVIMNSYYDATAYGTNAYSRINSDIENYNKFNIITKNLTDAIPMILGAILGGGAGESSGNWKEDILSIILKNVPPYVERYLQSPSRKEQYGFGYNVKKVTKNEDSLATNISVKTNEFDNISLTGINANQKAFDLNNSKIFLSEKTASEIELLVNNQWDMSKSIFENNFVYYNANTKTLTIPIMPNSQAKNKYDLSLNKGLENQKVVANQLKFKSKNDNEFLTLPKQAWVYNDSDFLNSDYYNKNLSIKDLDLDIHNFRTGALKDTTYLDPANLDNNKFTYKIQYSEENSNVILDNSAYMFNDFAIDDKQKGISYVRPYYQYENIELFIPENLISKDTNWANESTKTPDKSKYFKENIEATEIPESVKNAWESMYSDAQGSKYIKIKPYSLSYKRTDYKNKGLGNIIEKESNYVWYASAMRDNLLKQEKDTIKYLNSNLKIDYKVVDILNSYNASMILMDQKIANIISNYSLVKKQDVKNNVFEDDPKVKAGHTITDNNGNKIVSEFDRYELHNDNDDIYLNDWTKMLSNGEKSINYSQYMWSNMKYSNVEESIDLTTGIWQGTSENNGLLMIGQSPIGNISDSYVKTGIISSKLLSTEKELIKQITGLAIILGAFFIIIVIITASLLIMLIGDIYIASLQRFMILMKSFGYSNWKTQKYSFGVVSVLSILAWLFSTLLAAGAMSSVSLILAWYGLAIPMAITWWPFIVSAIIIGLSFFGSLSVITRKVRKGDPAGLLNETHE
ncbi:ABC transporter permease [Mesoplasma tabanidae]|uniref:ABC transporter permease n=1 Tax=Mesoplasma tabanidae TaxID=219745 RepID=A0A2K8P401_9MOLU|nr:ABC transporter permease [Mesoplasma tabanidae]ATZ21477.1 ABC transporter permease [Mesoplasma tabanidae]